MASGRNSGLLIVAVLAAAAGGGWWWHTSEHPADQHTQAAPPPVPVQVATADKKDLPVFLTGVGTVQAYNTVVVHSRVDGELTEVNYTEGQDVKQGQLLAQIDPRPFQAALDQAVAKQAQDEAQLTNAKLVLTRASDLAGRGFGTTQDRDTAQASVNQLTAAIQADAAAIENARVQLGYTTITAPLTGRTGLRLVDRGNIVHATDTTGLVQIVQLHPIAAVVTIPEKDLLPINAAVKAGPVKVWATTPDGGRDLSEGKLLLVDNTVDMQSGTVRLKAEFPNADDALWPGQSLAARVLVETLKDVLAVPDAAVLRGPQGAYAYVVGTDNKVSAHPLKTGESTEGQTIVLSGLDPGDAVVTAGHYRLRPGVTVKASAAAPAEVADRSAP